MKHGEEHLAASSILNSMGMLYKKQGKYERGQDAYERALKIGEDILSENHPEVMATRHNLGELFIEWGKPERARELFDKNVDLMNAMKAASKQ
mmetsp:Transcript_4218/g.7162  ORF Transcript_4218/g.7162 Transcript_4218/m.7162 type:complete len:93 (-) Transcript_4218:49-327(-)